MKSPCRQTLRQVRGGKCLKPKTATTTRHIPSGESPLTRYFKVQLEPRIQSNNIIKINTDQRESPVKVLLKRTRSAPSSFDLSSFVSSAASSFKALSSSSSSSSASLVQPNSATTWAAFGFTSLRNATSELSSTSSKSIDLIDDLNKKLQVCKLACMLSEPDVEMD
ncbi:hypothetical protein HDU79_003477 [Rhizoclosmatium sp. JEL0117]|nr:hypothetical protein HDU79_003477 [Rhizoclosmatium sp. JEL0117]